MTSVSKDKRRGRTLSSFNTAAGDCYIELNQPSSETAGFEGESQTRVPKGATCSIKPLPASLQCLQQDLVMKNLSGVKKLNQKKVGLELVDYMKSRSLI